MAIKAEVERIYMRNLGETPTKSVEIWTREIKKGNKTLADLKQVLKESRQYAMEIKAAAGKTQKKSPASSSQATSRPKNTTPLPTPETPDTSMGQTELTGMSGTQASSQAAGSSQSKDPLSMPSSSPKTKKRSAQSQASDQATSKTATAPSAIPSAFEHHFGKQNTYQGVDAEGAKGGKLVELKLLKKKPKPCLHGPCEYKHCIEARVPMNWIELWCIKADCSVVDLIRCPMGLWKKNPKTMRIF